MIFTVLKSTIEQEVIDANNQICVNAGIPNSFALKWADVWVHEEYFYIPAPNSNGWNGYSQAQLMQNVNLLISELEIPDEVD